ncbi:MAG: ankyrin repeat domain-containing protein [Fuerstiella sp.]|nr:ankyrin repeat domain-containing protein [Fuerstiella sp.]
MRNYYRSVKQVLVVAVLTTIGIVGCGDSGNSSNGDTNTTVPGTTAQSQPESANGSTPDSANGSTPDSASTTESESALVSAPGTPLTDAAVAGNIEAVRQHIATGTDLNERNPEGGSTALIAAATFGQNETACLLIEADADLEVRNNDGSTALHTAAFLCREKIVKALLAKGADRNARNNAGSTALDSVAGPFDDVKPIYDLILVVLGPYGLELDYEFIKETRPKVAEMLLGE